MLVKALIVLVPTCLLLIVAIVMFSRGRSLAMFMQLLGAGSLVVVAFAHICQALNVLAWMHCGSYGIWG
jgi:hypothetical protein